MAGDLRVRVLGRFEVEGVSDTGLGSRKARTMLKALALARGRPVPIDTLVDVLWGDQPPAKPSDQLSVLASRARAALGTDRVVRTDAGYALSLDWLDLDAMTDLVGEAERRLEAGAVTAARAAITAALALARGPLLADEPDATFVEVERLAAERLRARAHHVGGRAALAAGDSGAAAELAERALDHDPFDEEALRLVMTARVQSGRPASALAAYARMRARLSEELGVDPSPQTEQLHTEILVGQPRELERARADVPPYIDLPGRADELEALDAALAMGGLVVVEGEPGIGKTRLVAEWTARVRATGTTVLVGRCEELGRALPLQPVIDALVSHFRDLDDSEIERVLGDDASLLGPLLGRTGTDRLPTGAVDQGTGQLLLFQALVGVVRRLAPVVLALDDLPWAAPLTIEWLQFAASRLADVQFLAVISGPSGELPMLPADRHVTVGPLDLEAVVAIAGADRAPELLERSGGNPLFLVALADAGTGELPASVLDAVAARAERAGPDVAGTLRAAAVLADDIDLDLLAGLLGMSPVLVLDQLEEGTRRRLLVEEGGGFRFAHALTRQALAAGTSASRRALLHREAGRSLAARPGADPVTIAHHARLGGDTTLAAEQLVAAAELASAGFDQAEAERLVDESLALVESAAGWLAKARIALLRRRYDDAARASAIAFDLGAGAPAKEVGAWTAHYQRRLPEAIALANEAAALARNEDERAACLLIGGWARFADADLEGSEIRFDAVRRRATGALRGLGAVYLGMLRVQQGRVDEGLALLEHDPAGTIGGLHGYPRLHALMFRAIAQATAGRPSDALATATALGDEVDRVDAERWRGRHDNIRGWILRNVGRPGEADECNERTVAVTGELGLLEPLAHGYLDLACGALLAGDLDRASSLVARARETTNVEHAMRWRHQIRARLLDGRIALKAGDTGAAVDAGEDVLAEADRLGLGRYRVTGQLLVAQAAAIAGDTVDHDALGVLLEQLVDVAGLEAWWLTADVAAATRHPPFRALAERRVAELASRAGQLSEDLERAASRYLA